MEVDHITATFLEDKSFVDLMALEREMSEEMGDKPLSVWKGPRRGLINFVLERKEKFLATAEERAERKREALAKKTDPWKAESVRDASMALLCMVQYYEDTTKKPGPDNRLDESFKGQKNVGSVGYPYNWIIDQLQEIFPNQRTTHECLRWYSVKAKANEHGFTGYTLPRRRPRERNRHMNILEENRARRQK